MSEKQKKKNKIIGISIGILVVLLVVISSTYAYWQITKSQEGANDIIAACLDIDMESVDGTFGLNPAWPISDTEGMNLKGYTFKVTNNCEEDVNYIIGMDSLEVNGVDYLDYNSIKVSIDDSASMIYDDKETIEHIEENDQYTIRTSKKIATSTVRNGQPNEHNVKVWIKSDAPIEEQSRVFSGRMFITGGQNIEVEPQAKLIATGDISRTKECDYKEENCTEVTGNDVKYHLYDDGKLIISGTGATKDYYKYDQYYPLGLYNEIINNYIVDNNITLTTEEQNLLNDYNMSPMLSIFMNDNVTYLQGFAVDAGVPGEISTREQLLDQIPDESFKLNASSIISKLSGFPKVTDIIIEDGITKVGTGTFIGITANNLYMNDSVNEIAENSFAYGGFTDNYRLSNNLEVIENHAFDHLMYNGTLKLPDSLISLNSFIYNASLKEIIIPRNSSVTSVPYGFFNDVEISTIILSEYITSFDSNSSLDRANITIKIYGPEREIDGLIIENNPNYSPFKEIIWNYQGE